MVSNTAQADDQCNLIVNYLPQALTDEEFEAMFKSIGELKSSKIIRDKSTGYSYGYGFVEFKEVEHAQEAIKLLDGLQLQNKRLKVSLARTGGDVRASNLYVSNLPQQLTEDELTEHFVAYGSVVQTRILMDPATNVSRGVGFIRFATREEAQRALDGMNGRKLNGTGNAIGVKFAEDNREKAKKAKEAVLGVMNPSMMGGGLNASNMMGMGNQMGRMQAPFGMGNNPAALGMGLGMGAMGMGQGMMGQGIMGQGLMGAGPMDMNHLGGLAGMNSQFGAASNQFGMGYQGGMGGGPMRGGNQMRQRVDPMAFGNTTTAMKGMNGNGTGPGYILFVYNIGPDTDERALWQLFYPFGALQKVNVIRDTEKKQGKGYGFVTMVNLQEAYNAIQNLNGIPFKGKQLQVSLKQSKTAASVASPTASPLFPVGQTSLPTIVEPAEPNEGGGYTLFVYNIGMDADEKTLWSLFHLYGAIQRVNIIRSSETNLCKGFGFVTMVEKQPAMNAIKSLNGFMYNGRALQVSFKQDGGAKKEANNSDASSVQTNSGSDANAKISSFYS